MTLLSICQDAAEEIGFPAPSEVVGNSDANAKQLLRLANRGGKVLSRAANWQALKTEYTFPLVTSDQDYALPSDFGWIIPTTTWNRTSKRIVLNPVSSEEWQFLKGWSTVLGLNLRARIIGDQLVFEQEITSAENGETIAYEYISNQWCESSVGAGQSEFQADTDVSRLDEELITLDVVWRFRKAKGLEWQSDFLEYKNQRDKLIARDGGMRKLCFGSPYFHEGLGQNVPEQGYG